MASKISRRLARCTCSIRYSPCVPPSTRSTCDAKSQRCCSASTQRTPKPSSAHNRLPMPSTTIGASSMSRGGLQDDSGVRDVMAVAAQRASMVSVGSRERATPCAAQRFPGVEAVPRRLHRQPLRHRQPEGERTADGGVGRHGALPLHELVNAAARDAQAPGRLGLRQRQRREELSLQESARMHGNPARHPARGCRHRVRAQRHRVSP
mmetsp:Transcript_32980/g.77367  ORF Transcript_32980/g.77367 Transcript_32980/m.77367 type:complete len:208 (-) Transcript_32980:1086-1709(-)